MNKKFFLLLFLFIICKISLAQYKNGSDYILKSGLLTKNFSGEISYLKEKFSFREIEVLDVRYDTSKIGYGKFENFKSEYAKIKITDKWSDILNGYFASNLEKEAPRSLLLVIRSFWIHDGPLSQFLGGPVISQKVSGADDYKVSACSVELDLYIKTDSLLPFIRLNHVFLSPDKLKEKKLNTLFFFPFDSLAEKIIQADPAAIEKKRKKIALTDLKESYARRFNLPVLNAGLSKGVFLTFDDFINNKPSYNDFRFTDGELTDELYVRDGNKEEILAKYWGFSDGSSLYIKSGLGISKAVRQQDTFEIYGAKNIVEEVHDLAYKGLVLKTKAAYANNRIMQLNMATGLFY